LRAVRFSHGPGPGDRAVPWLLQQLAREIIAGLPGSDFAARRYSQLVLVEVLRAYMDQAGSLPSGWLRAAAGLVITTRQHPRFPA